MNGKVIRRNYFMPWKLAAWELGEKAEVVQVYIFVLETENPGQYKNVVVDVKNM